MIVTTFTLCFFNSWCAFKIIFSSSGCVLAAHQTKCSLNSELKLPFSSDGCIDELNFKFPINFTFFAPRDFK